MVQRDPTVVLRTAAHRVVPRSVRAKVRPPVDQVLDRASRAAGRRRFLEAFDEARAAGSVKINIGAGAKPVEGWINCDVVWRCPVFLDVTEPWPVPAGSVDLVYADNVIEHLTLQQGRLAIRNAYEALAPGGVFRLATPDVEAVARQYLENGELARLGMERNREKGRDFDHPVQLIQHVFVGAQHYLGFCYDYAALSAELAAAGFEPRRVASGQSEHPDLRGLEVRCHPAEEATALVVEGVKPQQ